MTLKCETPVTVHREAVPQFLAGLDGATVEAILGAARQKRTTANQIILTSGDLATQLFLVRKGSVRYYKPTKDGDEILLNWLAPGDVFGLGSLLKDPPHYLGSAQSIGESQLFIWGHAQIRSLAARHPQVAENSLRIVLNYLKVYMQRHVSILTKDADHRLAEVLLDLAQRAGKVTPTGVEIGATNEQLGDLAHISPFTTSRVLSHWRRKGLVSKLRQRVVINAPEDLPID